MISFSSQPNWAHDLYFSLMTLVFAFSLFLLIKLFLKRRKSIQLWLSFLNCLFIFLIRYILYDGYLSDYFKYHLGWISKTFYDMPTFVVWIILIFQVISSFCILIFEIQRKKTNIDITSIKEAVDKLSVGLCFFEESGLPVLLNNAMNEIAFQLFGKTLLDASDFWNSISLGKGLLENEVVKSGESVIIKLKSGKVKSFSKRKISQEPLIFEIIAIDTTEEYELSRQLMRDNEEISLINKRLKEYGKNMGELIKGKEIISMKVRIHDELGQLLLKLKKCIESKQNEKIDEVLLEWQKHSTLMKNPIKNPEIDFNNLAKSLGVEIIWEGKLPLEIIKKKILSIAIRECMTNTVSHGKGNKLFVKIEEENEDYFFQCHNNGSKPEKEVVEGGGLSTLRILVENEKGSMKIISDPLFMLQIILPKENIWKK